MDSCQVDTLCQHFNNKLHTLETIVTLREAHQDDTSANELEQLQSQMEGIENELNMMRRNINEQKTALRSIQAYVKDLVNRKAKLAHMTSNLPSHLPKQAPVVRNPRIAEKETSNTQASNQNSSANVAASQSKSVTGSSANQQTAKHGNVYCPEIEFLTLEEFNQVPKYLKGRFTYDRVNKFIEGMNTAYDAKYKLLRMKKSTMSDANRKKCEVYNTQITKDTKGCYFIADDDLKEYGNLKIDNAARSILTILRHCGRVREVHGGRLTRYVYLEHY